MVRIILCPSTYPDLAGVRQMAAHVLLFFGASVFIGQAQLSTLLLWPSEVEE